ncbi:asparagine synthase (glutamine-hydrolyzing) [uncultured Jannaschia sp.]|uniref:asparagine synthase (glutamine-hydrolyzing) n=1 Tax=uncultured Jannaschia sp. TaxID=293347 RepID=UPI00261DB07A|nr:asparagine synthase (glutamine-hydrolyzing) [uncultured Jannaschia sp.]
MCGLAGFLYRPGVLEADRAVALGTAMTDRLNHRGPDADGHWSDPELGIVLGHRRLSILDLSEAGAQPFVSPSGRYVLSYNGEIYNHAVIRRALEEAGATPAWRGTSDTETLAAAIDIWGIEEAVSRTVGMFAFALWDRERRTLSLCRDRAGEKPLYWGWTGTGRERRLVFASQLSALWVHPGIRGEIDRSALVELLRHRCVGGARSIHPGIRKVLPGTIVTIDGLDGEPSETRYWSLMKVLATRGGDPWKGSQEDAIDALEVLLLDAVGGQMISDVPLGAFLSGGIDSSLAVALMQRLADCPVRTFSIGFDVPRFDEAPFARDVAEHLGTEHTEVYVGERELLDIVPALPNMFDEPFADASQIPTALLARITRKQVTVALSGDGGDEFFGGYDRYRQGAALTTWLDRLPLGLRMALARGARAVPDAVVGAMLAPLRPAREGKEPGLQWARRMGRYLGSPSGDALHRDLVSFWRDPVSGVRGAGPADDPARTLPSALDGFAIEERMMADDLRAFMVDDILAKVDRATMAASLESRAPFLDHRVMSFAASLPLELKIRDGKGKWILRELLARYVPRALFERPKMGFEAPIGAWIRGPLKPWASDLLSHDRLVRTGHFEPDVIEAMWHDHQEHRAEWGHQLWSVLMFESWLDQAQVRDQVAERVD